MITNRQNLQIAYTGFKAAFNRGLNSQQASDYTKIAMTIQSTTSAEKYGWLGNTTAFREWLGERVIQSLKQHDYTIKNKTHENTVGVPREDIEDDTYGIYTPLMQQLGQDAAYHPDEMVFELLKAGFDTPCYDGQNFFDDDHPVLDEDGKETSVSNLQDGDQEPWYLLDTTRVIKPIIHQTRRAYAFVAKDNMQDDNVFSKNEFVYGVDGRSNVGFGLWQMAYASKQALNYESFNAVYSSMQSLKGDNGRPLGLRPNLLVVPPNQRAAALEVVKAERKANGATNINRDVVDVLSTAWLA